MGNGDISRVVAGGNTEMIIWGLVAALDRGIGWEVYSRVSTWVSLVVFGLWSVKCMAWGVIEGVIWGASGST